MATSVVLLLALALAPFEPPAPTARVAAAAMQPACDPDGPHPGTCAEDGQPAYAHGLVWSDQLSDEDRDQFAKLAAYRESLGLLPAGSEADEDTTALLQADGSEFYGYNHRQSVEYPIDPLSRDHAENDTLNQLRQVRAQTAATGGHARMWVDRQPCERCDLNGPMGSMLRAAGLSSVLVTYPNSKKTFHVEQRS